jgi:hypothetical protein
LSKRVRATIGLHTNDEPARNQPAITKHDRRFANGREHEAVETEALRQGLIVGIDGWTRCLRSF